MSPAVHDGTVNMIQNINEVKIKDTEDVESTPIPNDSPSSSDDESKHDYFGLLSSSSDEYDWMVSFTILYLSFVCYSLYDAVIMRAHSSRMEGSQQLVVVFLIVF